MLYGAIIGDICGSIYEGTLPNNDVDLFEEDCTFTDDTVCTCAVAEALLTDGDFSKHLKSLALNHPYRGYGPSFMRWFSDPDAGPYNSFGNGAIMRVSPTAWAYNNIDDVLYAAQASAMPSHNHPEAIKAAKAIAHAIFLARNKTDKKIIVNDILHDVYDYPVLSSEELKDFYDFNITCQSSMPVVICTFNESNSFEECILNAIRFGGDTDTNAAVVGSIAEAYYGIPEDFIHIARLYLESDLLDIVDKFESTFSQKLQVI